ncbi:MAG: hypothetical protein ACT4PY_12190 [Armatimonadota bacterium]
MRKNFVAIGLLIAALSLAATVVYAQGTIEAGVASQWKTSVQHSKFSQDYNGMKEVTTHLQHVVNCLEGPTGPGFEGGAGNPCQGQGAGLIVDTKKAKDAKYAAAVPWMEAADKLAQNGLKQKNADAAKAYGQATQTILEVIGGQLNVR